MLPYILEISKYLITTLMVLYTLFGFLSLLLRRDRKKNIMYHCQCVFLFLIQFCAFLTLCLQEGILEYLFFYAFLQIVLFAVILLYHMIYPAINRLTVNNMCMLLSIGFIMLVRLDFTKAVKQFGIVAVSLTVALIIPYFIHNMKFLKKMGWIYAAIGILALSLVLILGQITNGSRISYTVGGITLQPSEFVKIIFVFFVASFLHKNTSLYRIVVSAVLAGTHVLILVLSRDLGSALIFFAGYVFMLYIATQDFRYLLAGACGGAAAAFVAYRLFAHVQVRVQAWKDPWSVIDKEGYQITQSLFAIGSGGWFGLGLFKGNPKAIPFVETDFIFSAIVEEMGLIFGICLILVCISCFLVFMRIALRLRDSFYQLVAAGLGVMFIFQIFLTIGGGIKFIPLTGVTLPLISYGGSSVLTTLIMFAIIQGLFIIRQDEGIRYAKQKKKRMAAAADKLEKERKRDGGEREKEIQEPAN